MKMNGGVCFLLIVAAIISLMIVLSLSMKGLSAKLLPVLIGGGTLVLVMIELVKEVRTGKTPAKDKKTGIRGDGRLAYLIPWIWIGGFLLAIYLLGFNVATALFVFAYMKAKGTGWFQSVSYAVLTMVAILAVFHYVMKVDLYPGIVFDMFG